MTDTNHYIALVPRLPLPSQLEALKKQEKPVLPVPQMTRSRTTAVLDNIKYMAEKVKQASLFIFKASFSVFLYWINPSLFAMGFVGGIALDAQMQQVVRKMKTVWGNLSYTETVVGCFFCGLSLPVTMATTTLLWSAYLGAQVYARSSTS